MIHPTAIIDSQARIPESVQIGPHVLIEGPVELGESCVVQANAVLTGSVKLGARNTVGYGAIIGALPQDLGFDPATQTGVEIGDGNVLREYVTIHRATVAETVTRVGSNNFLMAGVHLAHDVTIGNHCVLANNVLLGGHVRFGDRVVVGGGSVFHQFIRIGSFVMVQGRSGMGQDVPPYTVAMEVNCIGGLNVVGLRRGGFKPPVRAEIKQAFKLLYTSNLNTTQALEKSRSMEWGVEAQAFWDFVAQAKRRGLCRLHRERGDEAGEVS